MPAVATAPQPVKYKMPVPTVGERVHYYTYCDRKLPPQIGTVIEVGGMSVTVRVIQFHGNDANKVDVKHVTDPRIATNPNVWPDGSWEFHPDALRLRELEERVAALEKSK